MFFSSDAFGFFGCWKKSNSWLPSFLEKQTKHWNMFNDFIRCWIPFFPFYLPVLSRTSHTWILSCFWSAQRETRHIYGTWGSFGVWQSNWQPSMAVGHNMWNSCMRSIARCRISGIWLVEPLNRSHGRSGVDGSDPWVLKNGPCRFWKMAWGAAWHEENDLDVGLLCQDR